MKFRKGFLMIEVLLSLLIIGMLVHLILVLLEGYLI